MVTWVKATLDWFRRRKNRKHFSFTPKEYKPKRVRRSQVPYISSKTLRRRGKHRKHRRQITRAARKANRRR